MSTYDFIVSSRDHRSETSDVEAGSKSPSSRKLFKVYNTDDVSVVCVYLHKIMMA